MFYVKIVVFDLLVLSIRVGLSTKWWNLILCGKHERMIECLTTPKHNKINKSTIGCQTNCIYITK